MKTALKQDVLCREMILLYFYRRKFSESQHPHRQLGDYEVALTGVESFISVYPGYISGIKICPKALTSPSTVTLRQGQSK